MKDITKYINNLVKEVINESAVEKAKTLVSEQENGEYNEQACKYHMENFGPEDERTKRFCEKGITEKLHGGQHKLDVAKPKGKITGADFKKLRSMNSEMEEGNAFTGALAKAKEEGKKEFEVDGKKFQVKEAKKEKWIQKTDMEKGALHKHFNIPEGEKIPVAKLKSLKKELMKKGEGDKKLTEKDSKLLKQVNLALTLKGIKENTDKNKFTFTESEMIDLIEKIINEQKTAKGLAVYRKAVDQSKKENDDYIKSVTKKMKEYLKNGSNGDFSFDPKIFPAGNGELKKMSKKAYTPSEAVEEYIEDFGRSAGMENLHYDEIKPNEDWLEANIEGSSKTGNNPKWANAVETPNNKKVNAKRKRNLYNIAKQQSYKRVPSPVTDVAGEKTQKGKMKVDNLLNQLESTAEKTNILNEEFEKINNLITYNRKTQ